MNTIGISGKRLFFSKRLSLVAFLLALTSSVMAGGYGHICEPKAIDNDSVEMETEEITETAITEITTDDSTTVQTQKTSFSTNDTTWTNPVIGSRVHLQRFKGTDSLVVKKRSIIIPVAEALGINFGVWAYDRFLQNDGWAKVNGKTIKHNLECSWVLDKDSYSGNQFSHPFHGSMFYNAARFHGQSYYSSALYPLVGSFVWEYFCETNEPSYNDFLSTGIGGSAIGEATHRVSDIVFDNSKRGIERFFREAIGSFMNPARGVHRLFSGEMWRVSQNRGKIVEPEPFSMNVAVGTRFMTEMRHKGRHRTVGYVNFSLDYGEHFDEKEHHKPFDFFHIHALLNMSSKHPTFGDISIKGRIATKQFSSANDWHYDLAMYQVYKYIDNYGINGKSESRMHPGDFPLVNEACSFGSGLYVEKTGRLTSFSNDFLVDAIPFGCTTADHFRPRRYSFATGFSISNDMRFCLNNKMIVGNEFYFARLFVWKGSEIGDPNDRNRWFWGDKGNNSVFINKAYIFINLPYNLKLHAEHQLYYRRTNYAVYPHIHAKSQEIKVGLVYSL